MFGELADDSIVTQNKASIISIPDINHCELMNFSRNNYKIE